MRRVGSGGPEIARLIELLAKLPGLGPRSARRAALFLIKNPEVALRPLAQAMRQAADAIKLCSTCGNLDTADPCAICTDRARESGALCVVEDVSDLWALERAAAFAGRYHVLGGTLSALDGVGPDELNIPKLIARVKESSVREVILATNATVDGQTTAHYIAGALVAEGVTVSRLAHGVPVGGEIDYLDDGTIAAAFRGRKAVNDRP